LRQSPRLPPGSAEEADSPAGAAGDAASVKSLAASEEALRDALDALLTRPLAREIGEMAARARRQAASLGMAAPTAALAVGVALAERLAADIAEPACVWDGRMREQLAAFVDARARSRGADGAGTARVAGAGGFRHSGLADRLCVGGTFLGVVAAGGAAGPPVPDAASVADHALHFLARRAAECLPARHPALAPPPAAPPAAPDAAENAVEDATWLGRAAPAYPWVPASFRADAATALDALAALAARETPGCAPAPPRLEPPRHHPLSTESRRTSRLRSARGEAAPSAPAGLTRTPPRAGKTPPRRRRRRSRRALRPRRRCCSGSWRTAETPPTLARVRSTQRRRQRRRRRRRLTRTRSGRRLRCSTCSRP
jgi:hypothetical protein